MRRPRLRRDPGFTIVELVVVIVIIGILAATALPRFVALSGNAHSAAVTATGAAFEGGVNLVHMRWLAEGSPGAKLDFIAITASSGAGALSVNASGWPADMRGTSLTMNSANDCEDVWIAVLTAGSASVSKVIGSADYQAKYSANTCSYEYQSDPTLKIDYNSNTGAVVTTN